MTDEAIKLKSYLTALIGISFQTKDIARLFSLSPKFSQRHTLIFSVIFRSCDSCSWIKTAKEQGFYLNVNLTF